MHLLHHLGISRYKSTVKDCYNTFMNTCVCIWDNMVYYGSALYRECIIEAIINGEKHRRIVNKMKFPMLTQGQTSECQW